MFKIIHILFILSSILLSNQSDNKSQVSKILEKVIFNHQKNASFRLNIDNGQINTVLDVDVLWLGNNEYDRKTRIKFIKPLDFENVHLWIWSFSNGEIKKWITKAIAEQKKAHYSVFLIPSRTDTKWFYKIFQHAAEIRFIVGRIKFVGAENSAPFPSMIVYFGPKRGITTPKISMIMIPKP